jgi:hypothetical protein
VLRVIYTLRKGNPWFPFDPSLKETHGIQTVGLTPFDPSFSIKTFHLGQIRVLSLLGKNMLKIYKNGKMQDQNGAQVGEGNGSKSN